MYAWWAPLLLAGAWLATHWLLQESGVWRDRNSDEVQNAQRHADYSDRTAVDPPAGGCELHAPGRRGRRDPWREWRGQEYPREAALQYVSTGRILIDDMDLARITATDWRRRLAGAFQDFYRFEFQARKSVGAGGAPRMEEIAAVETTVARAPMTW